MPKLKIEKSTKNKLNELEEIQQIKELLSINFPTTSPSKIKESLRKLSNLKRKKPSFNSLLPEIYHYYIFEFLSIDDLFQLKLVNKKLNLIVNQFKIKELNFVYYDDNLKDRWFYTNKLTDFKFNLDRKKIYLLKNLKTNLQFNLKRLRIDFLDEENLTNINLFKELEELSFIIYGCQLESIRKLSLQKLKYLSIKTTLILELDLPNLIALQLITTQNLNKFKFNLPALKYLKVLYSKDLDLFFNRLDYLECSIEPSKIHNLIYKLFSKEYKFIISNLKDHKIIKNLIKFSNLKLSYKGIHLTNCKMINDLIKFDRLLSNDFTNYFNELCGSGIELQIKKYKHLFYNINLIKNINYNELIHLQNQNLPIDFFKKFTNISKIRIIYPIVNLDLLIQFIKQSSNLYHLDIENSKLDQRFYDQLPSITSLMLLKIIEFKRLRLNFKFISRMFKLKFFETNQYLIFDKQLNLSNLNCIDEIKININGKFIKICKDYEYFSINDKKKKLDLINLIRFIYN